MPLRFTWPTDTSVSTTIHCDPTISTYGTIYWPTGSNVSGLSGTSWTSSVINNPISAWFMDWRCGRTGQVTPPDLSITSEIAAAEHRRATHVATKKAENLLLSALCEEQRKDLKKWGYFKLYVKAKDGGQRVYRIRRGQIRNIDLVEEIDGVLRPVKTLCAHPEIQVPDADAMLAQKLMLETDEEAFLKIANHMRPVAEALELFRPPGMLVAEEREREEWMRQADEEFHASLWASRRQVEEPQDDDPSIALSA